MLRSMYSGVSGLRGHQTMMDVVGNNIANVNTTGFKSSQATFQDLLSQVLQGAGTNPGAGGTNPAQVGLGMRLAGTSTNFTQGGLQNTGRTTDLSIQGDGFFAVNTGAETLYTRAGSFSFDAAGRLTTPDGAIVQGWVADARGGINTNGPIGNLTLPLGSLSQPQPTTTIDLGGNLPADAAVDETITTSITIHDDRGAPVDVSFTFTADGTGAWSVSAEVDGTEVGSGDVFDANGAPLLDQLQLAGVPGFATQPAVALGSEAQALTRYAEVNSVAALGQDGAAAGTLEAFTISPDGIITGVFSNGRNQALGQIALAAFNNPGGLEKTGGSLFRPTINSGLVQLGVPGQGGRGSLAGGTLEMSNVDLAQEFTNLIVAQRGFQANSRIVTSSDELLQELVNMKR